MRKLLLMVLAALLVTLIGPAGAQAADTAKHPKVRVHIIRKGEMKFDLSKPDERKTFIDYVEKGEVEEIEILNDPMAFSTDLGLWAIVVFLGLIFILRKLAWGPMVEGLQRREQSIRSAVDEAKVAREETERLRAKFKAEMDQAFAKIPAMMEDARRQGEKLAEEMRTKAASEITADRERLRREIELARDQALQTLWDQTAQLATLISANVLARSITPEDHQRMLTIAMEELKSSGPRFRHDVV